MDKGNRPKEIEHILSGILGKLEAGGVKKTNEVREAWIKSAGENTSGHSDPVNFKKGVLTVIVENSTWLYKLTLEKRAIMAKFNEVYRGRQKAKEIRFRVGRTEL
jgi:predicted nucleic acid-binding Zn ribbon protein